VLHSLQDAGTTTTLAHYLELLVRGQGIPLAEFLERDPPEWLA